MAVSYYSKYKLLLPVPPTFRNTMPPLLCATLSPSELLDVDFGAPLHSLVICGTTHPLEDELLKWHRVQKSSPPAEVEGSELAEVEGGERAEGGEEAEGSEREEASR